MGAGELPPREQLDVATWSDVSSRDALALITSSVAEMVGFEAAMVTTGTWTTSKCDCAAGGQQWYTSQAGATARFTATEGAVGLVMATGPARGRAAILLGLGRGGGIAGAADGLPGLEIELVLGAVGAGGVDRGRVTAGLAGGARPHVGSQLRPARGVADRAAGRARRRGR